MNYAHRYFVDGQITIADVDFGGRQLAHHPGRSQGAGGKSYYALDVTDPTDPKYLSEFTHQDLGFSYSNSTVSKLPNGEWAVLFTSGYNNDANGGTGDGFLFALNPETRGHQVRLPAGNGCDHAA